MAADATKETEFEIGHVLLDIVGYSKLLIEDQKERLDQLTKIVLATAQVRDSTDEQLVRLPIGDGMALVFRHSAEEPAIQKRTWCHLLCSALSGKNKDRESAFCIPAFLGARSARSFQGVRLAGAHSGRAFAPIVGPASAIARPASGA